VLLFPPIEGRKTLRTPLSTQPKPATHSPDRPPEANWHHWLTGRPLATADAGEEAIGKTVGLAVFASDALSSTAYATQEILIVLGAAGVAAFAYTLPIAVAIVALLGIVTLSYQQTIHAYPGGGGAYIVARDNLGDLPAQIAGAALLTDYILTVAVSVSSGVAQIASAFPSLLGHRVALAVGFVFLIAIINLRGVKESGALFAIPSYFFVAMMALTVGLGLFRQLTGTLGVVAHPPPLEATGQALSLFLILHAFSNGTTALTGVEAISNGVTAFKEPRSKNAAATLVIMSVILATLFLSITTIAVHARAIPSEGETVISQIARTVFDGRGYLYMAVIGATTLILVMAANTAFNGFPRLGALQAADGYLPRQLTYRGSRLVYSRGIGALAVLASLLIAVFNASVTSLIPLYAIGVFLSFTLSQAGMTRRWWSRRSDPAWLPKAALNGVGAVLSGAVMMVFAVTKFREGAWFVVILIPALVAVFFAIRRHYRELARALSLEAYGAPARIQRHRVILPISSVHRGTVAALRYARSLSDDITAVHVSIDPESAANLRRKWGLWGNGVRLVILESPYRMLLEPTLDYIRKVADRRQPNETITIVVPQFVPRKAWHHLLHAQTAVTLRLALMFRRGIVITNVPYHLDLPGRPEEGQD
jgi:amino acid transporter